MKDIFKVKRIQRQKRARRTRAKIFGTAKKPRLSIFKSNKHIYLQLIDDEKSQTLASVSDLGLKKDKGAKSSQASQIGNLIAKKAQELKIKEVVFDKGSYKYHGIVKTVAEGAREGGLKF